VDLFLQQLFLLLFTAQPQTLVQNNLALLQPQRRVVHPLLHEQDIISLQALGMGSNVIRCGTSSLPSTFTHPISSGFGRMGYWQDACFHTDA
jgi:hypothetical protein